MFGTRQGNVVHVPKVTEMLTLQWSTVNFM
jgi:hypothetical protein